MMNYRIKNEKNWLISGIIVLELIMIFHFSNISPDYFNYISLINQEVKPISQLGSALNSDFLFYFTTKLLKKIGLSAENIILTIATVAVLIKNYAFKKINKGAYISIIYGASLFWIFDLIQLRLCIATTLIIIAFSEYDKNRFFSYAFFLTASVFYHASALVFLSLNLTKSLSKLTITAIAMIVIFSAILYNNLFYDILNGLGIDRIERYNSTDLISHSSPGILSSVNILSLIQIIIFLTRKNVIQASPLSKLLMPAPFIVLASLAISYQIPVLAIRVSELMFLPVIFNYSFIINKSNAHLKTILLFTIFIGSIYSFPIKHFLIGPFGS